MPHETQDLYIKHQKGSQWSASIPSEFISFTDDITDSEEIHIKVDKQCIWAAILQNYVIDWQLYIVT